MQRWQGLDEVPGDWGRCVVTIGVFDGVHRGHQCIIARAREVAAGLALPLAVITFEPHPDEVIRPGSHPPLLCSPARRAELLAGLGVGGLCVLAFTPEFARLGPGEFAATVLADRLHAAAVVVGENFRFGHRAAGDVALLAQLGEKYDFAAEGVALLADGAAAVSSSGIRRLLAAGDVAGAAADLGRPHRVEGVVVPGHRRGRAMGFPTANLAAPPLTAVPADGVYAGWLVRLAGQREVKRWPAAISVGTNPTFGDGARAVEAYALDAGDLDLYGTDAGVDFVARLRGMERFAGAAQLAAAMQADVVRAREVLGLPPGTAPRPGAAPPAGG